MESKKMVVGTSEMEVINGKVVISSEELAAAVQNFDVAVGEEEEANLTINFCRVGESR